MALTEYQQPASASLASDRRVHGYLCNEANLYSILSTNYGESKFKYVFRIANKDGYMDKTKTPPWTNGIGITTVGEKLRSLYTYSFNPSIVGITSIGANRAINYYLYVEDYYDGQTVTESNEFTKCIGLPISKNSFYFLNYIMKFTNPGKFLSDFTGDRRISVNDEATIQYLNGQFNYSVVESYISRPYSLMVWVYPTEGNTNTYNIYQINIKTTQYAAWSDYPSDNTSLIDLSHRILEAPAGPVNINSTQKTWIWQVVNGVTTAKNVFTPGAVIDSTTWKYQLICYTWIDSRTNGYVSETLNYIIDSGNCGSEKIRIAWENYYGGTDYFNFYNDSVKSLAVDRKTFQKTRMTIGTYSGSYPSYVGGETTYDADWKENYIATTDYITEKESLGLESLWTSKNVFAYIQDTWYPIILEDSDFQVYDRQTRTAYQYIIKFRKSNRNYSVENRTIDGNNLSNPDNGYVIK